MKKTFALILLILFAFWLAPAAYADWRYGISASYDNTGATWTVDNETHGTRNISGFSIGPTIAYEVVDYFSVQSGLYFSMNGFATAGHSYILGMEVKAVETARLFYLQLPVYAVGQLPLKNDALLLLEVGPHLACGVASHITTEIELADRTETQQSSSAFEEDLSRFNAAMHFGIGAEYMGARIMLGYNLGLYNMALKKDTELRSGGFFVSVGYMF